MVAKAVQVDENRFMINDTDDRNELTLSCGTDVPIRGKINGNKIIQVAKGCWHLQAMSPSPTLSTSLR